MGMAVGGRKGAIADMNVVPLIDILLVLLIIFMVITPLTPKGLDALVPQPSTDKTPPPPDVNTKLVVVQVLKPCTPRGGCALKINQEDATWETLEARLTEIFKIRAERVAFIKGDDDVDFEQVARAIDIMHNSNIDKVGLITSKVEAGQ
jgi:biopolymer transport protein TolR